MISNKKNNIHILLILLIVVSVACNDDDNILGEGLDCLTEEDLANATCPTEDLQMSCEEYTCNGSFPATEELESVVFECAMIPLEDESCTIDDCSTITCGNGDIWVFDDFDEFGGLSGTLFSSARNQIAEIGCGPCILPIEEL